MDNDKATILRKDINLHQSTGGHYCIDFFSSSNCSNIEDILYLEKCLSNKQSKVQVTKIHKQLNWDMKIVENIEKVD